MILPGATLGMLGGGQLGRMFTVAARTMGYSVIVLDPDTESPAGRIADEHIQSDFHDEKALKRLSEKCTAITTEFENVPADTLELLAQSCLVRPSADAVKITQDRINEKTFFQKNRFPTNRFVVIADKSDLSSMFDFVGAPAILKRSRLGYDGKGQWKVNSLREAVTAFETMGSVPCVLEEMLSFEKEMSVVLARGIDGKISAYPPAENIHVNGILDATIVPAKVSRRVSDEALKIASDIAIKMNYHGVMAVEFFVMPDRRLLINEIAPRPHNSGHFTLDACVTNQFEQQVRTLCGLPLGAPELLSPVVMMNLLGDLWSHHEPNWADLLKHANVKLHLYGKNRARPGRKMGHFNVLDEDIEKALRLGKKIKTALAAK
jgi:5-(carboxyamino)imidazole ribonucleotide synthase